MMMWKIIEDKKMIEVPLPLRDPTRKPDGGDSVVTLPVWFSASALASFGLKTDQMKPGIR